MRFSKIPAIAALTFVTAHSGAAQAALIRFDFAGTFEDSPGGSSLDAGDSFSASFVPERRRPFSDDPDLFGGYDTPFDDIDIVLDGVTPANHPGPFVNFAHVGTDALIMTFNLDPLSPPFLFGPFARFQARYNGAGLFGSSNDLSTLNTTVLQSLTPQGLVLGIFETEADVYTRQRSLGGRPGARARHAPLDVGRLARYRSRAASPLDAAPGEQPCRSGRPATCRRVWFS